MWENSMRVMQRFCRKACPIFELLIQQFCSKFCAKSTALCPCTVQNVPILKKCFKNIFATLIFFALNCCPLTALHASGPKCCILNNVRKISKFVKMPHWPPSCFPLCVWTWSRLDGATIRPLTPQTCPASFHHPMRCTYRAEIYRAAHQAPNSSSLTKTLVPKVVFALSVFHT